MNCIKKDCNNIRVSIDKCCEQHRRNKSCLSKYGKNLNIIKDIINKIKHPLLINESNPFLLLTGLIHYSIRKKDIKYFLLFLYLHDIMDIVKLKNYSNWFSITTYDCAYETNKFSILDLEHYKDNIKDKIDEKIYFYLLENLEMNNNYLLKRYSWLKLDKLRMLKIYSKCIGKLMVFYYKTLEKTYEPGGPMYDTVKKNFEIMCEKQKR